MPAWITEALKQGGLFAVAVICLALTVAAVRIFLWIYKRLSDRNDLLVDRAHDKGKSDMKVIGDMRATVDKQADAIDSMADQVDSLARQVERLRDLILELYDQQRKTDGTNEG